MEDKILNEISKRTSQGKKAALIMITAAIGSTPRKSGAMMGVLALCGLWAGVMGGKYGSRASTGFARNLR